MDETSQLIVNLLAVINDPSNRFTVNAQGAKNLARVVTQAEKELKDRQEPKENAGY